MLNLTVVPAGSVYGICLEHREQTLLVHRTPREANAVYPDDWC